MIVVSDTSPLTSLAAIRRFDLLRALFGEIYIAEAVWEELNAGGRDWPGSKEVASAPWVRRHGVRDRALVQALMLGIDHGEAEAIALAIEVKAELVLLDDRAARRRAQSLDLNVMGLVGVLIRARRRGLIPVLGPELRALREQAAFHLAEDVVKRALAAVGEVG